MIRLLKFALVLLLMWPLNAALDELIAHQTVGQEQCESTYPVNSIPNKIQETTYPYWPAVELNASAANAYQLVASRIQRWVVTEYTISMKSILQKLADREAAVSQHQERIYDTTISYFCEPASQYYVYTLRRILI